MTRAAFLASIAAFGVAEVVRLRALVAEPFAFSPTPLEYAQAMAGGLLIALVFGLVLVAWRIVCSSWANRRPSTRVGRVLHGLVHSILGITLPVCVLVWLAADETRIFKLDTAGSAMAALAVIAAAPLSLRLLQWGGSLTSRLLRRYPRSGHLGLAVAAGLAALGWATALDQYPNRYGRAHLILFGALVLGYYVAVGLALHGRSDRRHALEGAPPIRLWVVALLVALLGFLAPAGQAAREIFYAVPPSKWFALTVSSLLPDSDGDGWPGGLGLVAAMDCDDSDASRHPMRRDVPGNGLDENCFGGDLPAGAIEIVATLAAHGPLRSDPLSVLLITVDGWRFERGTAYGVDSTVMPRIAELARGSLRFKQFRTCSSRTRESLLDLLYGSLRDVDSTETDHPIRALSEGSVHTILVTSSWMDHFNPVTTGWVEERISEGHYRSFNDAAVIDNVVGFLSEPPHPFFLFTHLLSMHGPYERSGRCAHEADPVARYRCAAGYIDELVGRVLDQVESAGLLDELVIVVTSDHGEELFERGALGHAFTVYDEVLHVPLLIRIPGRATETVSEPMCCFDLMPTIIEAAGLRVDTPMLGRDFSQAPRPADMSQFARARPASERGAFEPQTFSVVHRERKLLFDRASGVMRFYDLGSDPAEQRPVPSLAPAVDRALIEQMDAWLSAMSVQ